MDVVHLKTQNFEFFKVSAGEIKKQIADFLSVIAALETFQVLYPPVAWDQEHGGSLSSMCSQFGCYHAI